METDAPAFWIGPYCQPPKPEADLLRQGVGFIDVRPPDLMEYEFVSDLTVALPQRSYAPLRSYAPAIRVGVELGVGAGGDLDSELAFIFLANLLKGAENIPALPVQMFEPALLSDSVDEKNAYTPRRPGLFAREVRHWRRLTLQPSWPSGAWRHGRSARGRPPTI